MNMNVAPMPSNEEQRLAAVAEWCVAHQDCSTELRTLVEWAGRYFNAPMCLISIVSECQQWFMAKTALEADSTPRDVAFCAHTILQAQPLEVLDATQDPRFAENPLVTGAPGIRYYCGAPLLVDKQVAIGSFCIIDTVPREAMDDAQRGMLQAFADMAVQIIAGIRHRNFYDQPTGLFNRVKLECDVQTRLERHDALTVVVFDIMPAQVLTHMIKVLGYNFAHDLTLQVKDLIVSQLDPDLALYKISPTRFAVIVHQHPLAMCARVIGALSDPVQCHQIPVLLDAAVGISPVTRCDDDGSLDWLRRAVGAADAARGNPSRCAHYQPEVDAAQRRAFSLLTSLGAALQSDDELSLHLQPRVELQGHTCNSAEALLRWRHPHLGDISPAEFIALAEKTALIASISLWVMRAVLNILQHAQAPDLRISMNVTARDLENAAFMDTLLAELQHRAIAPWRLQLEFTESVLIEQPEEVRRQLLRARQAGIDIAIDDFGTGYSNWAYLSRIPATLVKLDRSLIQKATHSAKDLLLVQSLVGLANQLGYQVVAEGIETAEQLTCAKAWGCTQAQGYYLARPMPLAAFQTWYCNNRLRRSQI